MLGIKSRGQLVIFIRVEENENSEDVSTDSTEDIKPFQRPSIIVAPKSKEEINTNLYNEA